MSWFGFFYYSKKMDKMTNSRNYCKTLTGKIVQYTEWVSRFPFVHLNKWDDNRLVGIGFYHHTEDKHEY